MRLLTREEWHGIESVLLTLVVNAEWGAWTETPPESMNIVESRRISLTVYTSLLKAEGDDAQENKTLENARRMLQESFTYLISTVSPLAKEKNVWI